MPLLRRALLDQDFSADHRLPFSGDETFRIALDAAFGLTLGHAHEEASWSANSLVLWLGAANALRWLAQAVDAPDLVAEIDAREYPRQRLILPDRYVVLPSEPQNLIGNGALTLRGNRRCPDAIIGQCDDTFVLGRAHGSGSCAQHRDDPGASFGSIAVLRP